MVTRRLSSWRHAISLLSAASAKSALSRKRHAKPLALSWMPWIFLFAAILFEVAGITSMKLSRGFAELLPSIGVFVFYICSAAAVIFALKRLELSVAYAIWSGWAPRSQP